MITKDIYDELSSLLQISHEIVWIENGTMINIGDEFKVKITLKNAAPVNQLYIIQGPVYKFKNIKLNLSGTDYAKLLAIEEPLDKNQLGNGEQAHATVRMKALQCLPDEGITEVIIFSILTANFDYDSFFKTFKFALIHENIYPGKKTK